MHNNNVLMSFDYTVLAVYLNTMFTKDRGIILSTFILHRGIPQALFITLCVIGESPLFIALCVISESP